jgi:hypothetical protein
LQFGTTADGGDFKRQGLEGGFQVSGDISLKENVGLQSFLFQFLGISKVVLSLPPHQMPKSIFST